VQWVTDSYAIGRTAARATMQRGGDSWYFLTVDYALGQSIQRDASEFIEAHGGRVLGASRHPLGTTDFSSMLLAAQASRARVIGLANASPDTGNAIKQAAEFGLTRNQRLVAFLMFVNDVHAIGLQAAQGLLLMEAFYWDMNEGTRAWSQRFAARHAKHNIPNDMQAGVYAGVLHYLKAVDKVGGPADGKAVVAAMKALPTDDPLFGKGTIREDGRKLHPMYLMQVKTPEESKAPWDYLKILATIEADQAFRPLAEGNCPLVVKK
jgi:branched-chain amino acid transport system substrate-binding protein